MSNGSGLVAIEALAQVCCFDLEVFGSGDFGALCDAFFEELKGYCTANHLQLNMCHLTRTLLGFSRSCEFPTAMLSFFFTSFLKNTRLYQTNPPN